MCLVVSRNHHESGKPLLLDLCQRVEIMLDLTAHESERYEQVRTVSCRRNRVLIANILTSGTACCSKVPFVPQPRRYIILRYSMIMQM